MLSGSPLPRPVTGERYATTPIHFAHANYSVSFNHASKTVGNGQESEKATACFGCYRTMFSMGLLQQVKVANKNQCASAQSRQPATHRSKSLLRASRTGHAGVSVPKPIAFGVY